MSLPPHPTLLPAEVGFIRLRQASRCRTRVNPSSVGEGADRSLPAVLEQLYDAGIGRQLGYPRTSAPRRRDGGGGGPRAGRAATLAVSPHRLGGAELVAVPGRHAGEAR